MTYIVVSENEIVKAEMAVPDCWGWSGPNPMECKKCIKFQAHCLSLPRIAIQGEHKWEVWQEVVEDKDFSWGWFVKTESYQGEGGGTFKTLKEAERKYAEWAAWDGQLQSKAYKPVQIAIPIQPTPEGESDAEKTVSQMAEIIQKECHSLVSAVMKESKKRITVQDATNAYMFHKLAELQLRINQLEQSSSITLLTNDNTQTK